MLRSRKLRHAFISNVTQVNTLTNSQTAPAFNTWYLLRTLTVTPPAGQYAHLQQVYAEAAMDYNGTAGGTIRVELGYQIPMRGDSSPIIMGQDTTSAFSSGAHCTAGTSKMLGEVLPKISGARNQAIIVDFYVRWIPLTTPTPTVSAVCVTRASMNRDLLGIVRHG